MPTTSTTGGRRKSLRSPGLALSHVQEIAASQDNILSAAGIMLEHGIVPSKSVLLVCLDKLMDLAEDRNISLLLEYKVFLINNRKAFADRLFTWVQEQIRK